MRVPSEDEMRAAAVRHSLIAEGDPIPPRLRGRVANLVLAEDDLADAEAEEADAEVALALARAAAVADIAALNRELTDSGIPASSVGRVLAALASLIWRNHHQ
ncbi:hypothetical protein SEA_KIKO_14 [Gordonia phage Kiko]|nr:hypothetical protein SEA_KIKO_14 [Gordonia phage Kiko]